MAYRSLLGFVCVAALTAGSAGAAVAGDFHGVFGGGYANLDAGGASADEYGIDGTGTFGLGLGATRLQVDGGWHRLTASGFDVDHYNIGGSLFWALQNGRVGGTVAYQNVDTPFGSIDATNYGGFGEWFAGRSITLAAKAGGFNATGSLDGYYLGGAATGYLHNNFALSGAIDYTHLSTGFGGGNETDYSVKAEWLVSEQVPVSVYGGYTYSDVGGTGVNTWMIGLRFYTDSNGASTLVDRQRSGTVGWAASFRPVALQF